MKIILKLAAGQQIRRNFLGENNPEGIHTPLFYKPDGALWRQEAPIYSAVVELLWSVLVT